jgi:hypothetical protein
VKIGHKNLAHAIEYDVTFTVPPGERHTLAQFEAVTGYMPPDFAVFWRFDRTEGCLKPLSDGPGEQADPVVLATKDGVYAMGVYSPEQPSKGFENAGYGRFRFVTEKVVKWNCVFRVRAPEGIAAGDYKFRCFLVVGSVKNCEDTLRALMK